MKSTHHQDQNSRNTPFLSLVTSPPASLWMDCLYLPLCPQKHLLHQVGGSWSIEVEPWRDGSNKVEEAGSGRQQGCPYGDSHETQDSWGGRRDVRSDMGSATHRLHVGTKKHTVHFPSYRTRDSSHFSSSQVIFIPVPSLSSSPVTFTSTSLQSHTVISQILLPSRIIPYLMSQIVTFLSDDNVLFFSTFSLKSLPTNLS